MLVLLQPYTIHIIDILILMSNLTNYFIIIYSLIKLGMDLDDDEPMAPEEDDDEPTSNLKDDDEEEHQSDIEHQKEDHLELEKARKERMDLMAAELKREQDEQKKAAEKKKGKGESGGEVVPFDKFQYLVGQSEVFAHFLAGKLYICYFVYVCYIGLVCLLYVGALYKCGICLGVSALVYTNTIILNPYKQQQQDR